MTTSTVVQIEAKVVWQFGRDPDSGLWMGVCHSLNLNAIGDTFEEAQSMANEAIQMLFRDLLEEGELKEFLRARGWSTLQALPVKDGRIHFDLPYATEMRAVSEFAHA